MSVPRLIGHGVDLPEPEFCEGMNEDGSPDGTVGILWLIGDLYLYLDVMDGGRTVHWYGSRGDKPGIEKVWRAK